jgi:hypothetical protein
VEIPSDLILAAEDIRYLRHVQLAALTGIDASNFPAWYQGRQLSERTLERLSQRLSVSKAEILKGFELRRQDAAIARNAQSKALRLITYLGLDQETA